MRAGHVSNVMTAEFLFQTLTLKTTGHYMGEHYMDATHSTVHSHKIMQQASHQQCTAVQTLQRNVHSSKTLITLKDQHLKWIHQSAHSRTTESS